MLCTQQARAGRRLDTGVIRPLSSGWGWRSRIDTSVLTGWLVHCVAYAHSWEHLVELLGMEQETDLWSSVPRGLPPFLSRVSCGSAVYDLTAWCVWTMMPIVSALRENEHGLWNRCETVCECEH